MMATVGVEIVTLVIAAVAAVASVAAVIINVVASTKLDHKVWIREMRVGLYSKAMESADEFGFAFVEYSKKSLTLKDDTAKHEYKRTNQNELLGTATVLSRALLDVGTFGSARVAKAANNLGLVSTKCLVTAVNLGDLRVGTEFYVLYWELVSTLRAEVRGSMKIPED